MSQTSFAGHKIKRSNDQTSKWSNDPLNQYSPYQPGSPLNFSGSGSREFLQFPGFYYSSSHGMQQGAEQFNPTVQTPSSSLPTEPSKPGPSPQKSHKRWQTKRDEAVLVQLWADNIDCLDSKDSRKAWDEIVRALNDKQGITKTVDQCQRKLKHLKNLYKEKKDWNRKQSGGNIQKSPHYDAIDAVLGCRDVITCNKLRQVGITTPEPALDAKQTPEGRLYSFSHYLQFDKLGVECADHTPQRAQNPNESAQERLKATQRRKALGI